MQGPSFKNGVFSFIEESHQNAHRVEEVEACLKSLEMRKSLQPAHSSQSGLSWCESNHILAGSTFCLCEILLVPVTCVK